MKLKIENQALETLFEEAEKNCDNNSTYGLEAGKRYTLPEIIIGLRNHTYQSNFNSAKLLDRPEHKESLCEIQEYLSGIGFRHFTFLNEGDRATVLNGNDNQLIRIATSEELHEEGEIPRPESNNVLQPIIGPVVIGGFIIEVVPRVLIIEDLQNQGLLRQEFMIEDPAVEAFMRALKDEGLDEEYDISSANIGLLSNGKLVVADGGGVVIKDKDVYDSKPRSRVSSRPQRVHLNELGLEYDTITDVIPDSELAADENNMRRGGEIKGESTWKKVVEKSRASKEGVGDMAAVAAGSTNSIPGDKRGFCQILEDLSKANDKKHRPREI